MQFSTSSSPHVTPQASVSLVMRRVIYALIPGVAVYMALFGWGVLFNLITAAITAAIVEAGMLKLRGRPIKRFLSDWSAVLSALLLALALPPTSPWWMTIIGTSFAMVFAKHLYGGLGNNPMNPAMVGYVVLFLSFPNEITRWLPLGGEGTSLADFSLQLDWFLGSTTNFDSLTQATALDSVKTTLRDGGALNVLNNQQLSLGYFGSAGWEWVALAYLAGGVYLLTTKTIRWQIPVSMLLSLTAISGIFWLINSAQYASPVFHLFSGAAILGAFFIATDPVSASTTIKGRLIYGAGIGALIFVIRTWANHPDGVAFAVLLMNICVPLIDYYTQPKVYGHAK